MTYLPINTASEHAFDRSYNGKDLEKVIELDRKYHSMLSRWEFAANPNSRIQVRDNGERVLGEVGKYISEMLSYPELFREKIIEIGRLYEELDKVFSNGTYKKQDGEIVI